MLVKCLNSIALIKALLPSRLDEEHFYKIFTCFFCLFLLPFSLFWLIKGHYILALLEGSQLIFFSLNLRRIHKKQTELVSKTVVLAIIAFQLLLLSYFVGSSAALWTYPLLATYYFMLPIKKANYAAFSIVIIMGAILSQSSEHVFVIRYLSSAFATLIISNLVIRINSNLQNELLQQSISDPLTHCFNRRHMDTTLAQVIRLHQRRYAPVSILLIDIDHFKKINDRLGHLTGDSILQQLVCKIEDHKRTSDMLFRYGGEEFLLLLPDADQKSAMRIAENLRKLLATIPLPNTQEFLSVSIGVCQLDDEMGPDDWIRAADNALYQAKREGRNRVIYASQAHESANNSIIPSY